jgi:hypothetical protein
MRAGLRRARSSRTSILKTKTFVDRTFVEKRAALRELFLMPAAESEAIWAKLAAFEVDLVRERIAGPAKDCIPLLGLGSIKADLMNIGIKGGDV